MLNKPNDFVPIKVIEITCSQALYLNFDYFGLIHELSKALSEDDLLSIADDFVRSCASDKPEIVGVLLVGSLTIGLCDELVDFDIMVFTDERSLKRRKAEGKGYNEEYWMKDVEICVDWHRIETIEKIILAQRDGTYFWIMGNSKILYDPLGRLCEAISRLKPYSLELKR